MPIKSSSRAAAPTPNKASRVFDGAVNADRASIAYAAKGSRAYTTSPLTLVHMRFVRSFAWTR
jgi:hypothetical protein